MKKDFLTIDEAEAFVIPLYEEKKYVIDIRQLPEGQGYSVQWQEHKMYTAQDGKEYHDEVWVTQDGKLIQIQDLEEAHCRNILRMLIRQEREASRRLSDLAEQILGQLGNSDEEDESTGLHEIAPVNTTLH